MTPPVVGMTARDMSGAEHDASETTGAFRNRAEAGRQLGAVLEHRRKLAQQASTPVVLGLARGGVPVAAEVARALDAPLDVCVVRKLGVPAEPEFAFGAIAENAAVFIDSPTVRALDLSRGAIERVARHESVELQRRARAYRGDRPLADVRGKDVVLVDDGLATGATMRAAVRLVKQRGATTVTVAVPVGAPESVARLQEEAEVVCLRTPPDFAAVGFWYADFNAVTDDDVRALLR